MSRHVSNLETIENVAECSHGGNTIGGAGMGGRRIGKVWKGGKKGAERFGAEPQERHTALSAVFLCLRKLLFLGTVLLIYLCLPRPVTGPAPPPPCRILPCPEASVQGGCDPSSGSDLAPLRAWTSSQSPAAPTPPGQQQSPAVGCPPGNVPVFTRSVTW